MCQIELEIVFPVGDTIANIAPLMGLGGKQEVQHNVVKIYIIVSSQAVHKRPICVAAL